MVHQWGFFGSISAIRKIWSLTANSRSLKAAALKNYVFDPKIVGISDRQWDSVFGLGFGRLQGSFPADVVDTFQSIGDDRVWIVAFGS